jgi:hypothetical protein
VSSFGATPKRLAPHYLGHLDRHLGAAAPGRQSDDLAVGAAQLTRILDAHAQRAGPALRQRCGIANDGVGRVGATLAGRQHEREVRVARPRTVGELRDLAVQLGDGQVDAMLGPADA